MEKKSKSVKFLRYVDESFFRLMTYHYLYVASYIYLQSIKPATVVK